jgi:hypothetical protein
LGRLIFRRLDEEQISISKGHIQQQQQQQRLPYQLVLLPVCFLTKTSFLWYAMLGCVVTYVVGLACSLLLPPPPARQIDGLVVGMPGPADQPHPEAEGAARP